MKQKFIIAALVVFAAFVAGCKKPENSASALADVNKSANAVQKSVQTCSFVTLSGNITTNTTLSVTNIYKISGIVVVKSPATLTIPAGTVLEGIKSATAPAFLVIEKGAKLVATGTSTNPIIFTSDQAVSSRNPGDWGGIAFAGQANNNNSNSLDIQLSSAYTLTGGGTTNTDNSGNLQFVQIHFAGAGFASDELSKSALILNSVGTGTSIDHVQITNSGFDGLGIFGGTVAINDVVSYNQLRTDYPISYGYQGNMQFIASMRLNNGATPSGSAYGLELTDQLRTPSATATPLTQPVISNITVLGPNHCSSTTVNSSFKDAIHFTNDGAGKIYNSVFSAWNTSVTPSGLLIDNAASIVLTASNDLEFSDNSFDNSGSPAFSSGLVTWSSGCATTMAQWLGSSPGGPVTCRETGNQFTVATLGYDPSFCDDFCDNFTPNFVLGTTSLSAASFSWDSGSAFSHVTYRGAFGSTDFTAGWTQWCLQSVTYCM